MDKAEAIPAGRDFLTDHDPVELQELRDLPVEEKVRRGPPSKAEAKWMAEDDARWRARQARRVVRQARRVVRLDDARARSIAAKRPPWVAAPRGWAAPDLDTIPEGWYRERTRRVWEHHLALVALMNAEFARVRDQFERRGYGEIAVEVDDRGVETMVEWDTSLDGPI